ncbi:MAG: SpoIID/LytB domain-containing protein [Muribaculaceae bacterium]|nr:SpoIID/LytB domain-containing protein [Muribaculaceae bacterium]
MSAPVVSVGIMAAERLGFRLAGEYSAAGTTATGEQTATVQDGKILWNGQLHDEIVFTPAKEGNRFTLCGVTIGVNFHWERTEDQQFSGALRLIVEDTNLVRAINIVDVEEYLLSVISSEMSATASLELLKAHAVISRSWLLAQIEKNKQIVAAGEVYNPLTVTETEIVKWYDREDHTTFDVCADDHCQRYQGVTRQSTPTVEEAIAATRGKVLTTEGGKLCDARFSKCCGGVFEEFENCWEPVHHSYLEARRDTDDEMNFPDLTVEENAREWILGRPDAFCNTSDAEILSQVLNNYDQETTDFYRWKVEYTREELARLVKERSGIDFGEIVDLQPVARGTSGRLYRLRIVGTKRTLIIGKELEIRRTLSPSHLYSSAFVVERHDLNAAGVPERITLIGAGWGHGAGLCQIGAAVMGAKGYSYERILAHYFPGAELSKLY